MKAKYIGSGQYLRVFAQRIWGDPIKATTLEEVLKLPLADQIWLGVTVDFCVDRQPCPDALAIASDSYVEYESPLTLPTGETVARVEYKNASHALIGYPLEGTRRFAQLTIAEYESIVRPPCPHCRGIGTTVIRATTRETRLGTSQVWKCKTCNRRFTT